MCSAVCDDVKRKKKCLNKEKAECEVARRGEILAGDPHTVCVLWQQPTALLCGTHTSEEKDDDDDEIVEN